MHIRRNTLIQNREQIKNYNNFEKKIICLEEMRVKKEVF